MKKEKSHSVFGAYMGAVDEVHKKTKPKKNVVDIDFMDSIAGMMQSSTSFLHEKNTADDTAHGTADDTAHSTRYNRRHSTRYSTRGSNKIKGLEESTAHGTAHGTAHDFIQQTTQHTEQQTTQHTEQQTTQHTEQQTKLICSVNNPLSLKPIELLTQNQKKVLRSLIDEKGITKLDRLASMSGVKYSGVRVALDALSKRGFISRPKKYIEGIFQGIRYSINNDLCAQLFKQHTEQQTTQHTEQQTTQHTEQQTTQHTAHGTTVPYNNNSFLIYNIITPQILEHAEMSFWKEQGLTPEMIQKNIEGSGISEELFVQYMKHYAFKAERGDFKDKEINSHFEYFIGGLKRFSGWTRPNGYISHEEAEKQRLETFIAAKRKELEELEALKLEAEFLCFYENYIKTPDSEEVKAIMSQATSFDLDNLRRKPDKKEKWVRTIWNKARSMN